MIAVFYESISRSLCVLSIWINIIYNLLFNSLIKYTFISFLLFFISNAQVQHGLKIYKTKRELKERKPIAP